MSRITRFILTLAVIAIVGLGETFAAVAPSSQARFISFSDITNESVTLTVVKGNGNNRVVVFSTDGTVDSPVNGDVALSDADGDYSTGPFVNSTSSDIVVDVLEGGEWYINVTGLASGVTYKVKVFEFNNDGSTPKNAYKTEDGTNNPRSFTTLVSVNPPTITMGDITATTADFTLVDNNSNPASDGYILTLKTGGNPYSYYNELDISTPLSFELTDLTQTTTFNLFVKSYIGNSESEDATENFNTIQDNAKPTVGSIVFSGGSGNDGVVNENDNGEDFTFVVTFSEKMRTWLTPTFTFANPTPLDLSYVTGSWDDDGMVFTATVNFAGTTPQENLLIDVTIGNAEDLAGNEVDPGNNGVQDLFNIDNKPGVLSDFSYSGNYCRSGANGDQITFDITVTEAGYGAAGIVASNFTVVAEDQNNDNQITFTSADEGNGVYLFTTTLANTQAEGEYNLIIQFTDNAGNVVTDISNNNLFRIDNTPPSISGVNFANTCVKDADEVTLTFTATDVDGCGTFDENDIDIAISGDIGANFVFQSLNADVFTYTLNVPAGNDGTYDVTITATDDAGNESTDETTGAFTIDNTAPTLAALTLTSASCVNDGTEKITFTFTGYDEGCGTFDQTDLNVTSTSSATPTYDSKTGAGTSGDPYEFTYTLDISDTDGDYSITVNATDDAGNSSTPIVGTDIFTVDNTKPVISLLAVTGTTCLTEGPGELVFTFRVEEEGCGTFDAADLTVTTDLADVTPTIGAPTGTGTNGDPYIFTYTYDIDSQEDGDGDYTITVNATDDAGNAATEATTPFSIDNTGPTLSDFTVVTDPTCVNSGTDKVTITFKGYDDGCADFDETNLTIISGLIDNAGTTTKTGSGTSADPYLFTTKFDVAGGDGDGAYDITVNATDGNGNASNTLAHTGTEFNVDNTAPEISAYLVTGDDGSCLVEGETIEFTVTVVEDGCGTFDSDDIIIGITPALTNALVADVGNPTNGSGTYKFSAVIHADDNDGDYQITFNGTDVAGNTATEYAPDGVEFSIDNTPPQLTDLGTSSVPGGTPTRVGGTLANRELTITFKEVTGGCADLVPTSFVYTITGPGNVAYTQAIQAPTESPVGTWTTETTVPTNEPSGNYQIVVTAEDENGNVVTLDPAGVEFIIDNTPPYVTTVTASKSLLNLTDDQGGDTDFSITVQYNEDLDQTTVPTLEFHLPSKNPTSPVAAISPTSQTKPTTSSYTYFFSLDSSTNVDMRGIGVRTNGAIDLVGNQQTAAGTRGNLFGIDFVAPQLNSITVNAPSPAVILDDTPQLELVFDFTETMVNTSNPTVTFETGSAPNNATLGNILGTPAGNWNLGNVFTATYSVDGTHGLEVDNVGVGIANATDLAGNPFPGSFEAGVFDVDTKEPVCGSITMTPAAPQVTVADLDFDVVLVMDQSLDNTVVPTIAFTNSNANYSISNRAYDNTNSNNDTYKFTVTHNTNQENVTETMSISGLKDTHGNVQLVACEATFDVDTKLPTITSLSVSESNICGNTTGTEVITITFDEAMDATAPTITFNDNVITDGDLTYTSGSWTSTTVYEAIYAITGVAGHAHNGVDIQISGAKDVLGNTMDTDNTTGADKINVDTEAPSVSNIVFNTNMVNRSNIGVGGFQVVVTYNEAMDNTQAPNILFTAGTTNSGLVGSALSMGDGAWSTVTYTNDTYTQSYTVIDAAVDIKDITATMTLAKDACGNVQASSTPEPTFAIDLIAPTCSTFTAANEVIYEDGLDQNITIMFSEPMSTSVDPAVSFGTSTNFGTFTGGWDTQDSRVFNGSAKHNGTEEGRFTETITLDLSGTKPKDLAGNPIESATCDYDFDVDTKKPLVSSVTFTPEDVNGTGTLSVAVAFNEPMNISVTPTLVFPNVITGNTLVSNSTNWSDSSHFTAVYTVNDNNVDADGVTVTISDALDASGNEMLDHISTETFDIDQVSPTIVGLSVSDAMINKAEANNVGYTFTVTATFSEPMNTSANPTIAFAPDVTAGSPSLTLQAGTNPAWSVGNTVATWTYTASDQSVAIEAIDITITGGEDAFGNATDYTTNTGVFADKFDIDTKAPTLTFDEGTPSNESCVNGTSSIYFIASDDGFSGISQVQGRINSGSFAACTTGVQLNALNGWPETDGEITLELKAIDVAGNETTISRVFTADVTAPVISPVSFTNTCVTTGDVINIAFTVTEAGCGTIDSDDLTISGLPAESNGVFSGFTVTGSSPIYSVTATYTVGSNDGEGLYYITIGASDGVGNYATSVTTNAAFTIDKTAPSYSLNTPPTPTCTNKNTNVQLVIESSDGDGCGFYGVGNITASTDLGAATVTYLSGIAYKITVDLSGTTSQDDGIYDIDIVMTDAAGNVNNKTIEEAFTLDNTAPAITGVQVTPGCINGGTTATLTFNVAESGCGISNITVSDNVNTDGPWTWSSVTESGTYTYTLLVDSEDPDGAVDVTVSATDAAGNTTTGVDAGDTDFTIDNTAPVVAISNPLANATVNGTKVVNYTITETGCGINATMFSFDNLNWNEVQESGNTIGSYYGFGNVPDGAFTLYFKSTDNAGNVGTSSVALVKDTQAPTVTSVTPSDALISIADGGNTFTVAVLFSEGMNTSVNPTVALTANSTVANSSSTGVWSGGNTFTATFGTINGASAEEIANLSVTVSGAKDDTEDDGNVMTSQELTNVFSIDTKAPTCSSMTNNNAALFETDKVVTVTVNFSEAMAASPLPTLNVTGTSNLVASTGAWANTSSFTQLFTHNGNEETTSAQFLVGNVPTDIAGNPVSAVLCSTDVDIDTRKPLVSGVTYSTSMITRATTTFSVAVAFNETMGATVPTLTFNGGVGSAFSLQSGSWTGNTYTFNYNVSNSNNYNATGLTVDISGAKDAAGNVMLTKTSAQTYAIDQLAPTISAASIKSSNSINDQYAKGGHDILLTFTSSETLNTGAFTGNIAGYSISSISSLGTTYTLSVSTDNTISAGLVTFSIGFEDVNGNAGAALLTVVTNGSSVTVDKTPPVGTITLASGQADPTSDSPVNFALTFSENVYGLTDGDITVSGTAGATTAAVTGSGSTYNVAVSGMTGSGTVVINLATGTVTDIAGNDNTATTITDNTVQYDVSGATDVAAGAGAEPATLSSLVDTQGEAVLNFDFAVTDDGAIPATDLLATLITDITISQGTGNDFVDWTTILGGAELTDGTNTVTGTVGATTIAFTGLAHGAGQIGEVTDNATKTYTLKVWLSNAPSGVIDNMNLAFKVNRSSFTADGAGSKFAGGAGTDVESGSENNAIDVDATKLVFTTTPTNTEINTNTTFVVEATDANGNRDVDYGSALTSFLANQSTITSGNTGTLSSGTLTLNAVKFSTAFANDYVTAKAAGLSDGVSPNFNIREEEPAAITNLSITPNRFSFKINWSNPDKKNSLIIAKFNVSTLYYFNEAGMDNETNWSANTNYGTSATPSDPNTFVIYAGPDSTVTMLGLQNGFKRYTVAAYAYSGALNSGTQNFNENEVYLSRVTNPKEADYSDAINKGLRIGIDNISPQPANLNNIVSLQVETIEDMPLTLELYDSKGQLMMTLFEGRDFNAGETQFEFNLANNISSGQHFLRLTGNGHVVIAPLMIVK